MHGRWVSYRDIASHAHSHSWTPSCTCRLAPRGRCCNPEQILALTSQQWK
jgi:hypothetical protein